MAGREAGLSGVEYRHDRRVVGVSLTREQYREISRIAHREGISRARLLCEAADVVIARHSLEEPSE